MLLFFNLSLGEGSQKIKLVKVIPIPKPPKDIKKLDGWRLVNIVPALSKIAEKVIMRQMLNHLTENDLIPANHHGSIAGRSTQSLVIDLHDKLIQDYEDSKDVALVLLDQSKAYNIISHKIIIEKIKALNYSNKTILTVSSYLSERRQYVQIEHVDSEIHPVRDKSVTQGSTLSCFFFLVYILDIPQICHNKLHNPSQYRNCKHPGIDTFVDDNYVKIEKVDKSLEKHVTETMEEIKNYMDANKMALNPEKSQILIVSKNRSIKDNFTVTMDGKEIKHSPEVNILGVTIDEKLSWEHHVSNNLIPNLKN